MAYSQRFGLIKFQTRECQFEPMCPKHTISILPAPLNAPSLSLFAFISCTHYHTHTRTQKGRKMKSEIFVRQLIKNLNVQDNGCCFSPTRTPSPSFSLPFSLPMPSSFVSHFSSSTQRQQQQP